MPDRPFARTCISMMFSFPTDPIGNLAKRWGFSASSMGCHDGGGIEIWCGNRVHSTVWITTHELEAAGFHMVNRYNLIYRKVISAVADAILNRKIWVRYGKMPHELSDKQLDEVMENE